MAIYPDLKSMIHESVNEYLFAADLCVSFRKDARWPSEQAGGCLGYPAAAMLLTIVDTIGSFHRGNAAFSVSVDGRSRQIQSDGFHHFFILNTPYYSQSLGESAIKTLYANYRSLLVHNASLAPAHFLINLPTNAAPFPMLEGRPLVNIPSLLTASHGAVQRFLGNLDHLLPGSQQADNIGKKR